MKKHAVITIEEYHPSGWFSGTDEQGRNYSVYYTDTGEVVEGEWFRKKRKNISKEHHIMEHISRHRIKPECPYYRSCGGCDMQHLTLERELVLKAGVAERLTGKAPETVISSPETYGYRNNMEFTVRDGMVGLHGKHSRRLVDIEQCLLAHEDINKALKRFRREESGYDGEVRFRTTDDGVIYRKYTKYQSKSTTTDALIYGEKKMGNVLLHISPDTFFQSNDFIIPLWLDKISQYVSEGTKNGIILDLYCGSGAISLSLASTFSGILGIENNPLSIFLAKLSAEKAGLDTGKVLYIQGDLNDYDLEGTKGDVVVVNPPRGGLSQPVMAFLVREKFPEIVYSSCNVKTFAENVGLLEGYTLEKYALVNMFPRTSHFEVVGKLVYRED